MKNLTRLAPMAHWLFRIKPKAKSGFNVAAKLLFHFLQIVFCIFLLYLT